MLIGIGEWGETVAVLHPFTSYIARAWRAIFVVAQRRHTSLIREAPNSFGKRVCVNNRAMEKKLQVLTDDEMEIQVTDDSVRGNTQPDLNVKGN
ncbi:MAG: hypothetical protein JOY85_13215, partial [Acidobacteriaceae bacterium]|nr:hypothetical protein [Acidobacteriaceae bacterium]